MRTPLTVLLGNARLLQHSLSDEDKKRIIDNIIAEIHRLENMDQQLLKLTTLQNEKLEIKQISVLKILREACVCQRKSVAKGLPKSEHLSTPQ